AGLYLELAALSFTHDKVLQQAARSNVCPQLEVGQHVARLANVVRARNELLQGNRLDHECSPDGMKAQVRITRPTSPKGSLHSQDLALRSSHAWSSSFQSVSREDGLRTWIVRPSRA